MTVAIYGNTYPVKDQIRALGGRWDAGRKAWMVPDSAATRAQALVKSAPASAPRSGGYGGRGYARRTGTGCSCGSVDGQSRASDCWTCRHDAE